MEVLTFRPGDCMGQLAFYGANIWATALYSNTVKRFRAKDGKQTATFPVGQQPYGIIFDGTSVWVANRSSDTVSKISRGVAQ